MRRTFRPLPTILGFGRIEGIAVFPQQNRTCVENGKKPPSNWLGGFWPEGVRKPDSVPPSACANAGGDDHSSSSAAAGGIKQSTRGLGRATLSSRQSGISPSYLTLLRVGFTVPSMLPSKRCALTAPFHPYPSPPEGKKRAVYFLWHFPWDYPHSALRSTLPCGVRTFLPDPVHSGRDRGGRLSSFHPVPILLRR